MFVLSSICASATSRMLCDPNDLGYNCDCSKSIHSVEFHTIHIGRGRDISVIT